MYARTFGASVLALTFFVTADSPDPAAVGSPEASDSDKAATKTEETAVAQPRIVSALATPADDVDAAALVTDCRAAGLELCKLVEIPRDLHYKPGSQIAVSSHESFDVGSHSYLVKYLVAVPLAENGRSVVFRVQSNQSAPTRGPLDFDYSSGNNVLDKGTVSVETKWSGSGRATLEVTLSYRYDTRRAPLAGATVNLVVPDVVASLSAAARHEFKVDADLRTEERIALMFWGHLPGRGTLSTVTLTGTVGLRRLGSFAGERWPDRYTLDCGGSVQFSERVSAGINMNYSWNDKDLSMLLFMELKDPPRRLRNILGGFYEPGNPR